MVSPPFPPPPLFFLRKNYANKIIIIIGANTLTFIIPAEIFPTCYRCTCHGISAAAGKMGSILAILIVYGIHAGYNSTTRQGLVFLLFATFMALGAIFSWAYLPDVQRRRYYEGDKAQLENQNLEELGEGYTKAVSEGQVFGIRAKWPDLRRRVTAMSMGRMRAKKNKKEEDDQGIEIENGNGNMNGNGNGMRMQVVAARNVS